MGKGARLKKDRREQKPPETHEPSVPVDWPYGHVDVDLTGDDHDECVVVTIHGVRHYLHSTTAHALSDRLSKRIEEWDTYAKSNGTPGVLPLPSDSGEGKGGPFDSTSIADDLAEARRQSRAMLDGSVHMFGPRGELTEAHFPLLGFIERAQAFSLGVINMVEAGNPLAGAALLRAFAENLATVYYVNRHPNELSKLHPGAEHGLPIGRVIAETEKHLPGYKTMYGQLSKMAHPTGAGSFRTLKFVDERQFTWQSHPTFIDVDEARGVLELLSTLSDLTAQVIAASVRELVAVRSEE